MAGIIFPLMILAGWYSMDVNNLDCKMRDGVLSFSGLDTGFQSPLNHAELSGTLPRSELTFLGLEVKLHCPAGKRI
jgi:hypothetical protein